MTGNQHVIDDEYMKGNQLILNGDPANDGRYQCTYEDKYGDERRRIFIVKTNNQLNVNESIRSKNGRCLIHIKNNGNYYLMMENTI